MNISFLKIKKKRKKLFISKNLHHLHISAFITKKGNVKYLISLFFSFFNDLLYSVKSSYLNFWTFKNALLIMYAGQVSGLHCQKHCSTTTKKKKRNKTSCRYIMCVCDDVPFTRSPLFELSEMRFLIIKFMTISNAKCCCCIHTAPSGTFFLYLRIIKKVPYVQVLLRIK